MSLRVSVDSGWMVGNSEVMFSLTVRATVNQRVTSVWTVTHPELYLKFKALRAMAQLRNTGKPNLSDNLQS